MTMTIMTMTMMTMTMMTMTMTIMTMTMMIFRLKMRSGIFSGSGDLKIKCTAAIDPIYWKSSEESIQVIVMVRVMMMVINIEFLSRACPRD